MSKFTTELKPGQSITAGDITITMERKSGQVARLVIHAPEETKITNPARKSAPEQPENYHGEHAVRLRPPALP